MFERAFAWTMRHGSRILFAAAAAMLIAGIVNFLWRATGGLIWEDDLYNLLYGYLTPAAYLLFGAVLTDRIRRD